MKKSIFTFFIFFVSMLTFAQQKVQSPAQFLGYELGDRFTRHHRMVEYFKHVDEAVPNVSVTQ